MKLMMRISPRQLGQVRGSVSSVRPHPERLGTRCRQDLRSGFGELPAERRQCDRAGRAPPVYGRAGEDRVAGETLGSENQAEIIWKSKGKRRVMITPRFFRIDL